MPNHQARPTEESATNATVHAREPTVHPKNQLNELTGREWIQETKSVWTQRGLGKDHPEAQIEREHPAPFSFSDISRLILFFTKAGECILDPFCGVASSLKAAAVNGREGVGIELSPEWVTLGEKRLALEVADGCPQTVIEGDSRDVLMTLEDDSFDFVVTSPPYWGILNKKADHKVKEHRVSNGLATNYGDDERDIANIAEYDDFLRELTDVFAQCRRVLRSGRYMSVVVSDFRHGSSFIPFHSDLQRRLTGEGWKLKGINVLVQNHKSLYPYGYPYAFVSNIHHQYILIFQK
jgi:DNA modification methylase